MEFLSKDDFIKKVFDYTSEKEWKFLGDKPAIVDFYAQWCSPCKAISPILDKLSKKYEGKLDIYKIDVDKENELSEVFGIQSIPTLLFIPIGNEQPQMAKGALPEAEFERIISQFLKIN